MKVVLLISFFTLGFFGFYTSYPHVIQWGTERKINPNPNQFVHSKKPNHRTRQVVLPNPDFLYSIAFYDLRRGPITILGEVPKGTPYFSVAFYQANTSNYRVIDQAEFPDGKLAITLYPKGEESSSGTFGVASPTLTGTLLLRYIWKDTSDLERIARNQQSLSILMP